MAREASEEIAHGGFCWESKKSFDEPWAILAPVPNMHGGKPTRTPSLDRGRVNGQKTEDAMVNVTLFCIYLALKHNYFGILKEEESHVCRKHIVLLQPSIMTIVLFGMGGNLKAPHDYMMIQRDALCSMIHLKTSMVYFTETFL